MSTSTIRGTIKNFSPKPDEGYYGVLIDVGQDDKWLNGDGDIPDNLSKGDQVKVEANTNGFIEINDIEVVGSQSNDVSGEAEVSDMDAQGKGEGAATESFVSKQERIKTQCAFKKAVDQVDRRSCETQSDYEGMVKELTEIHVRVLEEVMN